MKMEAGEFGEKFIEELVEMSADHCPILPLPQGFVGWGEVWPGGRNGGGSERRA